MAHTETFSGTVVHADIDLDRYMASTGNAVCCMKTLRRRVYAATTGLGHSALVLAVAATLGGVDSDFSARLFEVDVEDIEEIVGDENVL